MSTYAVTNTESFTVTHARHMAAKVAADLVRFRDFYGKPPESWIDAYEEEVIALLKGDYINFVEYGFERNGKWAEAVRYRALAGGVLLADDDPGKLRPKPGIADLPFTSFLSCNDRWIGLPERDRALIRSPLKIQRVAGHEPDIENGYWHNDQTYSAGGRGIRRSSIRRW